MLTKSAIVFIFQGCQKSGNQHRVRKGEKLLTFKKKVVK